MRIDPRDAPQVLRSIILQGAFDGEAAIWCPLGEFFGVGARLNPVQDWWRTASADGTLTARWVMPYQHTGRVALKNVGDKTVALRLSVTTDQWKWDDRSCYFHANWHCELNLKTRPKSDWNYLEIQGRGRYVGDTLTVISPQLTRADGATSWKFKVLAICDDILLAPDGFIFGNYDYLDKSLTLAKQGRVNEVDYVATDPARADAIAQVTDQAFANSASPTQTITEKRAYAVSNNFGGMDVDVLTHEIALAGLAMILFLTANVIAQSVRERFAEFATLRALGFGDASVIALVVLEAAIPCLAGASLGMALAAFLAHHIQAIMPPGFGLPRPTITTAVYGGALASAFLLAFASAALPAVRLMRMDIATALSDRE